MTAKTTAAPPITEPSHKVQYLTAGRNSRQSGGGAEASNYQKVYGTICCLQYKGTKNRQHKKGKLF